MAHTYAASSSAAREADNAFLIAKNDYKEKKKEVKKQRDSLRRRQEEYEHQEQATAEEHTRIIETLRANAAESQEALEEERRRLRDLELELGTLRGRLAHSAKEQSEWEQDFRQGETTEMEGLMLHLRKLHRAHPEVAAAVQAQAQANAALALK
uniref:Uncharacterized protein n=1 Tax=Haptolina brevifila TaxID=156173 RepID=A0A7S2D4R3_9EUKA|mmetsp:Transcript_32427/g.64653  ORF Transcript_32427/g.64653 Transcript_32427/m.64653 type:complete len:154 (+) Transcript_32427:94-555(+)